MKAFYIFLIAASTLLFSCKTRKLAENKNIPPVSSAQVSVDLQSRQEYSFNGGTVKFVNTFPAARLNDVKQVNDSSFTLIIQPENKPINPSPWYAFKVWSSTQRNLYVTLSYDGFKHRYAPKISAGNQKWVPVPGVQENKEARTATFTVAAKPDTTFISAQEWIPAQAVYQWIDSLSQLSFLKKEIIGKSILQNPIEALSTPVSTSKKAVVFLGRQHPPEVTGFLAAKVFIEEVLGSSDLAKEFRKEFQVICIPMINPDGVDAGHWRHSMAGVDLNRDWENFKQPETRSVKNYLERLVKKEGVKIYFGLDFHSTFHDVFYTNEQVKFSYLPGFSERWIRSMEDKIPGYEASIKPSPNGGNVSKSWLSRELGAEAITYEVGDKTPRPHLREIAVTAAQQMMRLILEER